MTDASTVSAEAHAVMQQQLVTATVELFAAYGMTVEPVSEGPDLVPRTDVERVVMAVIGYAGETLRGAIVLLAGKQDVRRWQTGLDEADASIEAIHDTVGEFANMLLGRLKTALLKMGVSFFLTTPTTASGVGVRIPVPHGGMSSWQHFQGAAGRIEVRLDVVFDPSFCFRTTVSNELPATAGDMMLF
jgi:CheY-specific phosphatase CheX